MQRYELWFQRNKKNTRLHRICLALICLLIFSSRLCGAQQEEKPSVDRSRVYKLNHLTAEQAGQYLRQLEIGRRVDALSEMILIVTSDQPGDLIRTSSVLGMLDREEPCLLRQWRPQPDDLGLPEIADIQSQLSLAETNYGTLLDPPPPGVAQPIILDVHRDALVVISAKDIADRVDSIVQAWTADHLKKLSTPQVSEEPNEPAVPAAPRPQETPAPSAMEITPAGPDEPLPMVLLPIAAAEPNRPGLVDQKRMEEPAEQPLLETGETAKPKTSEAAQEIPAAEGEPGSDEEYFNAELLKALTAAQENAQRLQQEIKAEQQERKETVGSVPEEKPDVPQPEAAQPAADQGEEKTFLEIIEELRRKSEETAEPAAEQPEPQPEKIGTETKPQTPAEAVEKEPASDLERLQQQLARQEQQIAELKELLMQRAREPEPPQPVRVAPEMSEPEIPEGEKELELTISLPEKVEITSLLELVGKQLGLNYMYDPTQVRGDVTLKIHDGKIKVKDTYALLESVLRFRGFIMTRRGNLVTIVPATQIKQTDPVIRGPDEPIEPGDVVVSSVFHLENVTPAVAQKMLTDMQLGTGFVPVAETNTLVVTDYAYRMDRIVKVIEMVDVAGEPKEFRYRQLQYMSAADMVTKLQALTAQMEGVAVSGTAAAATKPAAPTPPQRDARGRIIRTPTPAAQQAAPGAPAGAVAQQQTVFLDTDERTNRIMMIGYPDQIKMINELIDTLDVPKYYLRYVREYFIQHVEAAEIVTAMNELGLASVSVSGGTAAQSAAAQARRTPVRPGQPPAAQQAAAAAPTVTSAGEDQPYISIRPNTNSLLVNATKEQHDAIELVIAHVDVRQKDQRTIHEYEIQNVDAMSVVNTLEQLGIISPQTTQQSTARGGTAGRQASARQPAAQQPGQPEVPMALPTMEGETVTELTAAEPQIAILESTNSLLINATPRQHAAIALIIAHVDRERREISAPYIVYALENQDPDELAGVLNELIQETIEQAGGQRTAPDAKIQAGAPTGASILPTQEEERIRIISDPASYSLIVYANKKNQQWVGDLIKQLDQYRPQVLLDCTLVEITKTDDFNYDLTILSSYPDFDIWEQPALSGAIDTTIGESNVSNILDALIAAPDRNRFIEGRVGGGKFTGFFGNDKIMALLTAMQTKNYGRILANPKILVDDNQEGTIETKATTYITRTTLVDTPSETGPVTREETIFEPYDSSIKLIIKPHISQGDNLRLEIEMIRSDFTESTENLTKPPDQAENNVNTVVTVPDSSTIILGGMDRIRQGKGGTKVPVLGDIPLFGGLFRSTNNTSALSKLYIFIKPNILRPGEDMSSRDLRKISSFYRGQFEDYEGEMQRYEDWPGIDAQPMDPEKVLGFEGVEDVSEEEGLY